MNIAAFISYCVMMTFTPGPTNLTILSSARHFGTRKAMRFVGGSVIGFGLVLNLSVWINSALLGYIPRIIDIMKIVGSIYILYLAWHIYRMDGNAKEGDVIATFKAGFLLQLVNPKSVLFALTVIPSFIMPYYSSVTVLIKFARLITVIGFLAFSTWSIFGSVFKRLMERYEKLVTVTMSLFLVYTVIMINIGGK